MSSRNSDLHGSISTEEKVLAGALPSEGKVLAGAITPRTEVLSGSVISGGRVLSGEISSEEKRLGGSIPGTLEFHYSDAAPEYAGPYEVAPTLDAQTLETSGFLMRENMTIKEIPIYEVSNNSGGTTVIIGG